MIVAETAEGREILGVIDGAAPLGIETDDDAVQREFVRTFRYELGQAWAWTL